jgi:site-specific DNA-methyltransferase (adenine-specific)
MLLEQSGFGPNDYQLGKSDDLDGRQPGNHVRHEQPVGGPDLPQPAVQLQRRLRGTDWLGGRGAEFKDTWTLSDVDAEWINLVEAKHPALHRVLLAAMRNSDKSYLAYMAVRLIEMQRVLKPTGSIYLHCDPTMSHYLKLVMDPVFGRRNFRNEIVWSYRGAALTAAKRYFPRKHDTLLFYAAGDSYFFTNPRDEVISDQMRSRWGRYLEPDGTTVLYGSIKHERTEGERSRQRILKREGREPRDSDVAFLVQPSLLRSVWDIPEIRNTPKYKESTGYPTQKPITLLNRIISASSQAGDTVLDPFCGCATACIAAKQQGREWVGIDISPKAAELVQLRMRDELGLFYDGAHRTDIPQRTDLGDLPPYRSHAKTLYGGQAGNCAGCGTHFEARHLEVDHIIARRKDGTDHIANLQLLCGSCNRIKGDRGMEYLRVKLQL